MSSPSVRRPLVPGSKSVMIAPAAAVPIRVPSGRFPALDLLQQNWVWAKQWAESVPSERQVVEAPVDSISALNAAIRRAAALAKSKHVILFTGHGTRRHQAMNAGQFDTTPEPESRPLNLHKFMITEEVLDLPIVADKIGQRWVPKYYTEPGSKFQTIRTQAYVDGLAERFSVVETMREAFQQNAIDKFIVLTCTVGAYEQFCGKFVKAIGHSAVFYTDRVITQENDIDASKGVVDRRVQIWVEHPDPERPQLNSIPPSDPWTWEEKHPSYFELPGPKRAREFP